MNGALPDPYPVRRADRVRGAVEPPGSKSISHRALNLALIGQRPVTIENLLEAEDIAAFADTLERMGWRLDRVSGAEVRALPPRTGPPDSPVRLDCRSAGTLLRFVDQVRRASRLAAWDVMWNFRRQFDMDERLEALRTDRPSIYQALPKDPAAP